MVHRIFLIVVATSLAVADGPVILRTGPDPYYVAAGDLNGDGVTDLVVPCRGPLLSPALKRPANDTVSVYLGRTSGGFHDPRVFSVGFGPYTAIIDDIDSDGLADVAVANFQANDGRHLTLLFGSPNREAVFEPATHIEVQPQNGDFFDDKSLTPRGEPIYAVPGLTSLATGDFNRDGRRDLVAVAWSSDFIVVLLNQGSRVFTQVLIPALPGPRDVVVADFTGDRIEDLAVTLYSSNLVEVWEGDGDGGFRLWRRFHSGGERPYHLAAADLDGDGRRDIVVGNRGVSDNVTVFQNREERFALVGSHSPDTPQTGETTADEVRDVHLADLDRDGKLDLIAACHISHKVVVWHGTGDLTFGNAFKNARTISLPGKGPRAIAALEGRLAVAFFDTHELGLIPIPQ